MNSSVALLKYGDLLPVLRSSLITFNKSITVISCLSNIIDQLKNINNTLLILPSSVDKVFEVYNDVQNQVANLTKYQTDITNGVANLDNLNSSLASLPDFDNIVRQIDSMNGTLTTLPNLSEVASQVQSLNKSLNNLPDLQTYFTQISKFNDSLNVPNLNEIYENLNSMENNLNSMV